MKLLSWQKIPVKLMLIINIEDILTSPMLLYYENWKKQYKWGTQ